MSFRRRAKKLACVFLVLAGVDPARAASIEVSPVLVELAPGRMSAVMTVTNRSGDASAIQLRAFHWTQTGNDDPLVATDDVIVSPPIFQLGGGEQQTVRVLLRKPPQAAEATYRLLLDELPTGRQPGQIQFALRLSMPVFAAPADASPPSLAWRILDAEAGAELAVANRGGRHDRIDRIEVQLPVGRLIKVVPVNNAYVLAGVERHIPLPVGHFGAAGGSALITGHDDNGSFSAAAPIERVP